MPSHICVDGVRCTASRIHLAIFLGTTGHVHARLVCKVSGMLDDDRAAIHIGGLYRMLLKWLGPNQFIFVANTKCASNSFEASGLANTADVKLTSTYVGKHMPLEEIHDRFDFIFREIDFDDFFKFGIIRDPLQWVVSWFNYRSRPELADPSHRNHENYTGNMEFSDFWSKNRDQKFLDPQSSRFFSESNERIRPDYLIRLEKLSEGLAVVEQILGQKTLRLARKNRSRTKKISDGDVDDQARTDILEKYSRDYDLLSRLDSYNADRLEAFRARPCQNIPPQARAMNTLKNVVRDTPLESLSVSVVRFLKGIKRL